jgi:hypothetical protein
MGIVRQERGQRFDLCRERRDLLPRIPKLAADAGREARRDGRCALE